jgi:hypothetical protein
MYVVMQHRFTNTPVALARGEKLIKSEGAPTGAHGLQFYPARDGTGATCLWEASSVQSIQRYVDTTLGDSSVNTCYEVDAAQSFAQQPSGSASPLPSARKSLRRSTTEEDPAGPPR